MHDCHTLFSTSPENTVYIATITSTIIVVVTIGVLLLLLLLIIIIIIFFPRGEESPSSSECRTVHVWDRPIEMAGSQAT